MEKKRGVMVGRREGEKGWAVREQEEGRRERKERG